jgi:carbon starvation protein
MSALLIALGAIVLFCLGYVFYARAFEKTLGVDPLLNTPAARHEDGVDYVPAKHWMILFGHHFASIAGAAPILGPIIALSLWGWMPAVLWIVFGSILFGGIHDFGSLFVSLRHEGTSIADVARSTFSQRAKVVFSIFIWLTLILVIAVFVHFCAKTFVTDSRIVIPTIGLIPLAMLVGFMLYDMKFNLISTTLLALAILGGLLILGNYLPIDIVKFTFKIKGYTLAIRGAQIWTILLLLYAFFASITPVQILLQPRDYLCAFLLFGGMIIGFLGLAVTRPVMQLPAFVGYKASAGALWPMLFVTVACGAISGFHSLIASGTTSKQLANEKDARKISYGAMMVEGLLALMAVLVVAAAISNIGSLQEILRRGGGPIAAFSQGFAYVTEPLLGPWGGLVAVIILNAFILTTLDSATRIGRYITQELLGMQNRYISTFVVVAFAGFLALTGKWDVIWPMFGTANQLVAALALIVITAWLLSKGKQILFTLIPCTIMLATTVAALVYQLFSSVGNQDWLLAFLALALLGLVGYMLLEVETMLLRTIKAKRRRAFEERYSRKTNDV